MNNYRIQFLSNTNRITIEYIGDIHYRTLLQSLEDLIKISMLDRVQIVLDFRKTTNLFANYHQIKNFRLGLNSLFPKKAVRKMAIINTCNANLNSCFCSSSQLPEKDYMKYDMRCFEAHKVTDAFNWLVQ